jgi:hypothetical protein
MKWLPAGIIATLATSLACAHPLGNNTVNRQAGLLIDSASISVRYLVDLAEIPTLLAAADADADGDGATSADEWDAYVQRYGASIREGLDIRIAGDTVKLSLANTQWRLVPGAADLNTLRIEARLAAPLPGRGGMTIEYRDRRHPDEQGWKEVFVASAGDIKLDASDVPRASLSRDLTAYPAIGGQIPNLLTASIQVVLRPAAPRAQSAAPEGGNLKAKQSGEVQARTATQVDDLLSKPPAASAPIARPDHVERAAQRESSAAPPELPAWAFFRLGVHHIATGWDHLMFLLGLLVAQTSLRRLVGVVTAFTAAHSLTLGLAASGLVSLPGAWVEPAIALTIAYVGLSNLLGYSRHNVALAFGFGLVHGFGFAGALAESMGSLRVGGGGWLLDLAAFNIGIETFQLALILAVLPLLQFATRQTWSRPALNAASFAVMSAGLGWFFSRI